MVKIRLKRMGAKKQAFYRIVVSDVRTKRDGKAIEELGYYDAVKNPAVIKVDETKALEWLAKGAQPTETVRNILSKEGIMTKFHDSKYSK
ncbi:MAG: 30S ribosomal protein S16 [Mycoplasmatales bacterium]